MNGKKTVCTRLLAAILAIIMLVTTVPLDVYAAAVNLGDVSSWGSYDEALVDEMAALYDGDVEKARSVLDTLQANGLIDKNGNIDLGETFDVEGQAVTKDELRQMSESKKAGTAVTIDGEAMTWGVIQQMFTVLDAMELIRECRDSEVELTKEHVTAIKSFYEQLSTKGLTITDSESGQSLKLAAEGVDNRNAASGTTVRVYLNKENDSNYTVDQNKTGADIITNYALNTDTGAYSFPDSFITESEDSYYADLFVDTENGSFGYSPQPYATVKQSTNSSKEQTTYTVTLEKVLQYDVSFTVKILDGSYEAAEMDSIISGTRTGEITEDKKEGVLVIEKGSTSGTITVNNNYASAKSARKWMGSNFYVLQIEAKEVLIAKQGESEYHSNLSWTMELAGGSTESELAGTIEQNLVVDNFYNVSTESPHNPDSWPVTSNASVPFNVSAMTEGKPYDVKIVDYTYALNLSMTEDKVNYAGIRTSAEVRETDVKQLNIDFFLGSDKNATAKSIGNTIQLKKVQAQGVPENQKNAIGQSIGKFTKAQLNGTHLIAGISPIKPFVSNNSTYPYVTISGRLRSDLSVNKLSYNVTMTPDQEKLVNPEITIPEGVFYPGNVIPITVTLNPEKGTIVKDGKSKISLTVNGNSLVPIEEDTACTDKLTYLYTVKEIDQLTVNVTDFKINGTAYNLRSEALQYGDTFTAVSGADFSCSLNTPDKRLTFMSDQDKDAKPDSINPEITFTSLEDGSYRLYMPVFSIDNDPVTSAQYYAWLAGNAEQDKEGNWYVKSMYGSTDGGKTKIPCYIDVDFEEYSYIDPLTNETVRSSEKPVGVYFEFTPDVNISDNYELGSLELFMDKDIASVTDYMKSDDAFAAPLSGEGWLYSYLVEPSVLFDEAADEVEITYDYNGTWDSFVAEEDLKKDDHKISQVMDYAIASAEESLVLSYEITGIKDYTFIDAEHFTWSSSDPEIARIAQKKVSYYHNGKNVQKMIAQIIPTGKEGEVEFYLNVGNGSADTYGFNLTSASINIVAGDEPYLLIPRLSQEVLVLQNDKADIYFSTNITAINAKEKEDDSWETTMTLTVYPSDAKGNVSGESVYTGTAQATVNNPVTSMTIPENILDIVSDSGSYSYIAEISADDVLSGATATANALLQVKPAPVKVELDELENNYILDNAKDISVSWNIRNVSKTSANKEWFYVVTRKSDNTEIVSKTFTDFNSDDMSVLLDMDKLAVPENSLKEIFNISVYASNDPKLNGYAMDSILIYVYNADALDVLVRESKSAAVSEDGDSVVLDNTEFIESLLSDEQGDPSLALLENHISLQELRDDVKLSSIISINYGDYAWGLLSDQIAWKVSDESESDASLNYYQGGGYSDIEAGLMPTYLPTSNFMLTATKEGEFSFTATHVGTGMKSEITGVVKTLEDQLYLFQANPAVRTEVTYYRRLDGGEQELVTLYTDDKGSIAIYEPDGIQSDVFFKSEVGGDTLLGTKYKADLMTSEKNAALLQIYPVNNIKLHKASEVTIYLAKPDGTPLRNTDVTVRGGAYWRGKYSVKADLMHNKEEQDLEYPLYSNGLHDQIFKTDNNGAIRVYFDVTQLPEDGYTFTAEDHVYYAFECRFYNADGKEIYKPEVFEVYEEYEGTVASYKKQITLLANKSKNYAEESFIKDQYVALYDNREKYGSLALLGEDISSVGASEKFDEAVIDTLTYLWNYGDTIDYNESTAQAVLNENIPDFAILFQDRETKNVLNGQKNDLWVYPFSTFPLYNTFYTMNGENYGGVVNENGDYNWSGAWLASEEEKSVDIGLSVDGIQKNIWPMDFKITNTIGKEEAVESTEMLDEAVESVTEQLDFDVDKILGNLVPGGDMLAKGMSFFSGIATGGDYTIGMTVVPTADPTIYNVIVSVGEYEPASGNAQLDYSDSLDTEELEEELGDFLSDEDEGDEDEDEDEGEDDNDVEFSFSGYMIARATYSLSDSTWDVTMTGGEIGAKVGIKKGYDQNFMIASIPATISLEAKASVGAGFGAQTQVMNGEEEFSTRTSITIGAGIEAFVGIGFDYSIVALKIGIFGNIGLEATQMMLVKDSGSFSQGQELNINGEVGIKFVAKLLFFKYEKTFASVGFGWSKSWNSYDAIVDYWEGQTVSGQKYTAAAYGDGQTMFTLESSGIEDRDYLNAYSRVWVADAATTAMADEGWFSALQTNAYPFADPIFSEDGNIIVYMSDADSSDVEETVVCWAEWNGSGYTDKGAIAKAPEDTKETYGYGDSSLTLTGSDGKYFAAWVQQSETSDLAAVIEDGEEDGENTQTSNDSGDDNSEVSNEDVSIMMRSAEIMGAVFDSATGTWNAQRLTENTAPDLAPYIASNDNGDAMVVWRSSYTTSSEDPLDFNVEDTIRYTRYTDGAWEKESAVIYNGAGGGINGMGAAMADNKAGVAAYTIKTGDAEDSTDFETFYSYIDKDGTIETVRATQNNTVDENVQIVSVNHSGNDMFLLGWYTDDGEGNTDIQMLAINQDGSIDSTFPESISSLGSINATNTFRFAVSKDGNLSGLAIAWVEKVTKKATEEEHSVYTLQAVKLYEHDNKLGITGSQQMAEAGANGTIDYFDVYTNGDTVNAVANITDYSNGDYSQVGAINIKDLVDQVVKRDDYGTDEEYETAWNAEYKKQSEEYPDEVLDIYAADGEAKLSQASYTFKNSIKVKETNYDAEGVFADAEAAVTYTVENTGITPVSKILIQDGEGNTVKEENLVSPLLPGGFTNVTALYTMGDTIRDINFKILTEREDVAAVEGTIALNRPDIAVDSMELVSEVDGIRDINVKLLNNSTIPLTGNDKTVEVGFYLDSKHSVPLTDDDGAVTLTITPDHTDAMELIDNGAYIHQLNVDVEKTLQALYGEDQAGIPEGGVTLYAGATLYNNYGTEAQSKSEEDRKSNNKQSITFKSLSSKTDGEELSFLNTAVTDNGDGYTVTVDISNNTLTDKSVGNVMVELLDADGNVLASKQTYDPEKSLEDNCINLTKEGVGTREVTFTKDEIEDPDKVAGVNCYVCSDEAEVIFDLAKKATGTEAQTMKLGSTAVKPADPTSSDYEFKGWYADAAYTTEFDFENTIITKDTVIYARWKSYAPEVTEQPAAVTTVYDGKNHELSVTAECNTDMSYQWYKDGEEITGAEESTYKVQDVKANGTYYCMVTAEVNGKPHSVRSDNTQVTLDKREITLTADSASKRYDSEELTKNSYKITEGSLGYGDTLRVTVEGAITERGDTLNEITSAKVMRGDIDVTENYELTTASGTLRVTETEPEEYAPLVTAHPTGVDVTYDDKQRTLSVLAECDYEISYQWYKNGKALDGANDKVLLVHEVADSGNYYCRLTADIKGETVNIDTQPAAVKINKAAISVTAGSASRVHNGKELVKNTYTYTGTLASGHKLSVKIDGARTKPGTAVNKLKDVKVKNGSTDLTANYNIKTTNGKLKVTKGTSYRVSYRKNTKSKVTGIFLDINRYKYGKKAVVLAAPAAANRFFTGWNTKADGTGKAYKAGKKISVTTNVTLYAQWDKTYTDKKGLTYQVNSNKNTITVTGTTKKNAKSIKIPDTVKYNGITYKVTEIKKNAFQKMKKLQTVTVGKNVTRVGEKAFYNCKKLKGVTLGKSVKTIGKSIFAGGKTNLTITLKGTKIESPKRLSAKGKSVTLKIPKDIRKNYEKIFKGTKVKIK